LLKDSLILSAQPIGDSSDFASTWSTAFSRLSAATAPPRLGLRIALHQTALLGQSWYEQLAVARYQHWQRIGLVRKTLWKYGPATLARSLGTHGLGVSSLSWAGGFTGSVGFSFREAVVDARVALQEAEAVKAETLVIAPGGRAGHTFRHARRLVVDGLKSLVDDAAERQVKLALLVSPPAQAATWSCLSGCDDALLLLEQIGSPLVGLACPLPSSDGHPAHVDRWQRLCRHAWIVWSELDHEVEPRVALHEPLQRLARCGFQGVWELRSWSPQPVASPRDLSRRCRTISESLGLPESTRTGRQTGGPSAGWSEYPV
jgi:hypothetical protein